MMEMLCVKKTFNETKKKLSQLHSNIYYIGLVGFLMNFAATMVYTTLLLFIGGKDNIFGESNVIVIRNLAEALANFSKIFSGYISDKLQNRKTFLLIGYGAMIVTKLGFVMLTFKTCFPLIFLQVIYIINQIVDRCMNAVRDPARDAILMEFSTTTTRGMAFGIRKFVTSFGSIFSGIMTGILLYLWHNNVMSDIILYKFILLPIITIMVLIISYIVKKTIIPLLFTLLFIIIGYFAGKIHFASLLYIMSIIPVMLTVILVKIKIRDIKKTSEKKEVINLKLLKDNIPHMKSIFVLLTIMCFLTLGKLNDFCVFTVGIELGMSKYSVPLMFTVMYFIVTLASTAFGALVDKKKYFITLLVLSMFLLVGNITLHLANNYLVFWIGLLLYSGFLAASDSAIASIITFLIPNPNMKATIYGLFYGLSGFLGIINTIVVNILQNQYGLRRVYLFSTIPIIMGIMILIFFHNIFRLKQKD